MNLTKAKVETTGTLRGERIFRQIDVEWDTQRGIEWSFVPAREGVPAQHRIFVRNTTNRFERETGVSLAPTLITRFVDDSKRLITVEDSIAQAKREITTFFSLEERQGVSSFGDLHDLCDANTLGFLCDGSDVVLFVDAHGPIVRTQPEGVDDNVYSDRWLEFGNDVQNAVNTWIKGGHHLETP